MTEEVFFFSFDSDTNFHSFSIAPTSSRASFEEFSTKPMFPGSLPRISGAKQVKVRQFLVGSQRSFSLRPRHKKQNPKTTTKNGTGQPSDRPKRERKQAETETKGGKETLIRNQKWTNHPLLFTSPCTETDLN
jgi:hypothetical protein